MGKRKSLAKKEALRVKNRNWETFLCDPQTVEKMENLTFFDIQDNSPLLSGLLRSAALIWEEGTVSPEMYLGYLNKSQASNQDHNPAIHRQVKQFSSCLKGYSHWDKRLKMKELGLLCDPYLVADLLTGATKLPFEVKLVERVYNPNHRVKRYQHMNEVNDFTSFVVNEEAGFYVVDVSESVIFYSFKDEAKYDLDIELVIIRGVACSASFSDQFLSWIRDVVIQACGERRNIRPNHSGTMVQVGMNLGARHARVLGWAKSYTRELNTQTKIDHDLDAVGIISITWSLVQSFIPGEILDHVNGQLQGLGLPRLATRNIDEGQGFHIKIGDEVYTFPTAERAPPEAYLSNGYVAWTHTDGAPCTYAFSFCVDRQFKPVSSATSSRVVGGPQDGGASFVDIGLKVIVRQAKGTMMGFKPAHLHGTTLAHGAVNTHVTITLSQRLSDAWVEAKNTLQKALITAVDGGMEDDGMEDEKDKFSV